LEDVRKEYAEKVVVAKKEAASAMEGVVNDYTKQIDELVQKHEAEVENLKTQHQQQLDAVRKEAEDEMNSRLSDEEESLLRQKITSMEEQEKDMRNQISSLQEEMAKQRQNFDSRLRKVTESHTRELEELVSQLDLVEAEQNTKMVDQEKAAMEKDAIISALGTQLADANTRTATMDSLEADLANAQLEAKHEKERVTRELDSMKATYEQYVTEAEELKERACDDAREEMIERAEIQFRQANDLYVKLKKQYDASKIKVEKVNGELEVARMELDLVMRSKEESEAELRSELANIKALNAKIEADGAQKAKEYRREMERLLKAAKDFEKKAEQERDSCRSIQKTLKSAVMEKDKLVAQYKSLEQEHEEMKQVCEELMAELEGRQHEC
jgi:hypothetical protein